MRDRSSLVLNFYFSSYILIYLGGNIQYLCLIHFDGVHLSLIKNNTETSYITLKYLVLSVTTITDILIQHYIKCVVP